MRVLSPLLVASIGLSLAACSPAPADDTSAAPAPPDAEAMTGPASAAPSTNAASPPRIMHYDCEGTPVDASFDGRGQVSVAIDGETFLLRTEDGAEGERFVDEAGHVLWMRAAGNVLLMRPGRPDRICTGNEAMPA